MRPPCLGRHYGPVGGSHEGVAILQAALARERLGEYRAQAGIEALHADAQTVDETDWVQIVEWYDQKARTAITPHWVRFYDFGAGRLPRALRVSETQPCRVYLT